MKDEMVGYLLQELRDAGAAEPERYDFGGGVIVTVPVGYKEALEIEQQHEDLAITYYRWDRTNGVADERTVAIIHQGERYLVPLVVKEWYRVREEVLDRLEAQMDEALAHADEE